LINVKKTQGEEECDSRVKEIGANALFMEFGKKRGSVMKLRNVPRGGISRTHFWDKGLKAYRKCISRKEERSYGYGSRIEY